MYIQCAHILALLSKLSLDDHCIKLPCLLNEAKLLYPQIEDNCLHLNNFEFIPKLVRWTTIQNQTSSMLPPEIDSSMDGSGRPRIRNRNQTQIKMQNPNPVLNGIRNQKKRRRLRLCSQRLFRN